MLGNTQPFFSRESFAPKSVGKTFIEVSSVLLDLSEKIYAYVRNGSDFLSSQMQLKTPTMKAHFSHRKKYLFFETKSASIQCKEQLKLLESRISEQMIPRPRNVCLIPDHSLAHSNASNNLLQICHGSFSPVSRVINPNVRELDAVILSPDDNLCTDALEASCELRIPGAHYI